MDFKFYLERGDVKKVSPDLELAKSLRKDMLNRANSVLTYAMLYSLNECEDEQKEVLRRVFWGDKFFKVS